MSRILIQATFIKYTFIEYTYINIFLFFSVKFFAIPELFHYECEVWMRSS